MTIKKFTIEKNDFVDRAIEGFYALDYIKYKEERNPDFLVTLKNSSFNDHTKTEMMANDTRLIKAKDEVKKYVHTFLSCIKLNNNSIVVCVVPRSKADFSPEQLYFKKAVKETVQEIGGFLDGTDCIKRIKNTFTTHKARVNCPNNDGDKPYPGITKETCRINREMIAGKFVVLIDDIYTKEANVDEDCIQALLDCVAREVLGFFAVAKTKKKDWMTENDLPVIDISDDEIPF